MLRNIQPETYQRKARSQLQDIRHNLKLLDHITHELDCMASDIYSPQREVSLQKSERLKQDIRQKLKSMGLNINQMIAVLNYKITIMLKQINAFQKNNKACSPSKTDKKINSKTEQEFKYQINQLEQRIFDLQKKENQYVKQISELKEKNAKLREEFTNLSFDSNQRIKELSQKLHNNTSPNLTIKRIIPSTNPETSYFVNGDEFEKKKIKNNFVKIKGANNFEQELNQFQMSPFDGKKNKNMLDSFTSESSEYDLKGLGYEIPEYEQSSGNLKFGCFPGKQVSQKTKTGSSSQNKKLNFQQKCDKSRRFQFLLNNLVQNKTTDQEGVSNQVATTGYQPSGNGLYQGNSKPVNNYQGVGGYQYKSLTRASNVQEYKSVFNENVVKRYQI